jgi:hypothetical protein
VKRDRLHRPLPYAAANSVCGVAMKAGPQMLKLLHVGVLVKIGYSAETEARMIICETLSSGRWLDWYNDG